MTPIARYAKMTARPGQEAALIESMLDVARLLESVAGCELYLINNDKADSRVVWVTEVWKSKEELDAALELGSVRERMLRVLPLLDGRPELIELELLGGVGA
jgi:quinol monooxygenase YgiN